MYQGYQPIIQQIEADTGYSGTARTVTTKLNKLTEMLGAQYQHLIALCVELDLTTLTLSSGTVTPDELNLVIDRIEFNDGRQARFVGTGRDLAVFERYESGFKRFGDPITTASASTMQNRRFITMGPPRMDGSPTDFAIPNCMLGKGFFQLRFASMTTVDANVTAMSIGYKLWAICVAMDELRIPPFVERKVVAIAAEDTILGERLLPFACLGNDSAWGAIAAGDFAALTVKTGKVELLSGVDAQGVNMAYNLDMGAGQLGGNVGDARSAGDLSTREINPATPTALQASAAIIQPLLYCQPSGRLTKIPARIARVLTVKYSGSNTGTVLALTSVLPQSPEVLDEYAKNVADVLGESFELKLKLKMGGSFRRADARYLPYALKRKRAA